MSTICPLRTGQQYHCQNTAMLHFWSRVGNARMQNLGSRSMMHISRLHAVQTSQARSSETAERVVVFTTPGCQYCRKAKQTLTDLQVPYKEVNVSVSTDLRQALQKATGERTVPQVFVNGTLVGGSDRLAAKVSDGSFTQLLDGTTSQQSLPEALQEALQSAAAAEAKPGACSPAGPQLAPELQELATKLAEPQTGIKRAAQPGDPHSNAFTGQLLVDWLQQQGSSQGDRQAAVKTAEQLLAANVVTVVSQQQPAAAELKVFDDAAHWYRLRAEAPRDLAWGTALNTGYWWGPSPARPAEVVAEDLRGRILALYDKYLSADGKAVRYKALKQDPAFWEYVDATAELQRVDLSPLSREALMCFAINLYNTLCIHTLVVHGPERYNDTVGRLQFFRKAARYNVSGCDYVLDDLENGILRGNAPGASSVGMLLKLPWLSKGPFKQSDSRARHVVSPVDARIHFALNCGAASCPAIKLYSTDTLEEGLTGAAEAFCTSEVVVDAAAHKVTLSKILGWYYTDFGSDKAARLRFLLPYLPADKRSALQQLLSADPSAGRIKVEYATYDWTINAAVE